MLDQLTPDQFNEWMAFRQIEPDKLERLIEICKRGFYLLANAQGAKIEANDLDPKKEEERTATASEISAVLNATLGHGNRNR
ncbi:hypothetical protein [Petrachloros mirabilis]